MTNEEFIKKYSDSFPCDRGWNALSDWERNMQSDLMKILDHSRKDEAIRFVEWFIKYLMLENRDKYSIEERYNQFKQSKQ